MKTTFSSQTDEEGKNQEKENIIVMIQKTILMWCTHVNVAGFPNGLKDRKKDCTVTIQTHLIGIHNSVP